MPQAGGPRHLNAAVVSFSYDEVQLRKIIIDADDKNCLAELTVAQSLIKVYGNGRISLPGCFSLLLSFAEVKERRVGQTLNANYRKTNKKARPEPGFYLN